MASHAGLVLVFKNKNGYVDSEGRIVSDISEARRVSFYDAGFSDATHVLKKLGLDNDSIDKDSLKLEVLIPSYDSRLSSMEEYYREMGDDYYKALSRAEYYFRMYRLDDYERFKKYLEELKLETRKYFLGKYASEEVMIKGRMLKLHNANNPYSYSRSGYRISKYYYEDGEIYKYEIRLKNLDLRKYIDISDEKLEYYKNWQIEGLDKEIKSILDKFDLAIKEIKFIDDKLIIYTDKQPYDLVSSLNETIRGYYENREMHITRMFGSYVLLQRKNDELEAVEASKVPIKYCPLMVKLLKEVGGDDATSLIDAIRLEDVELQRRKMCELINKIVIKGGYFDTNRPLNSCEANVVFGASETISSAFKKGLVDAAVIVSNNLGTIITTNELNTQGAVKRMTGLFYTSPSKKLMETADRERIIPVFPYTAEIDQVEGVKEAIRRGYKRIAVTLAASDNKHLEEISKLEKEGITIYKFGLCSTGIDKETALMQVGNADVIWSCASKYVKKIVEPEAILQVGIKIPVHIMTSKGWEIVRNHLEVMDSKNDFSNVSLEKGEEKNIFINSSDGIKRLVKKNIKQCNDCPTPCI